MIDSDVRRELDSLQGKNASVIAYSNLEYDFHPLIEAVLDAAILIRSEPHYMSTWVYVTQWPDGTTVWQAPEGDRTATVTREGTIRIEGGLDADH